jgi:hypothetical protein
MNALKNPKTLFAVYILSQSVLASPPAASAAVADLHVIASALGTLMMIIMGIRWIMADSPNERAEAKKGMMYIVLGLLVIASRTQFIQLYRDAASQAGVTIP